MYRGSGRLEQIVSAHGQPRLLPRHFSRLLPTAVLALIVCLFQIPLKAQTPAVAPSQVPAAPPQPPQSSPDLMLQRLMRLRAERQGQIPPQPARPIPPPATQVAVPGPRPQAPTAQPQVLPPVTTPEPMKVDYSRGLLSVSAEKVPLSQVLQAISQRTGLQIHGLQEAAQPVSVHFSNIPVSAGVQNLLGDANYVLLGDLSSAKDVSQARVVLLSATAGADIDMGGDDRRPVASPSVTGAQRSLWRSQLMSKNPAEQDAGFREINRLGPKEAFDALKDVLDNGDGVARLRALQLMDQDSQMDRSAVMSVVSAALDDHDTSLRDYAIQALGRDAGNDSLNLLRQQLDTGDANVRLNVIQAVSLRPDARTLLQQAASDPDPSISALANELLRSAGDVAPAEAQPEQPQPEPQDSEPPADPPAL
jgi:hypothetical protein